MPKIDGGLMVEQTQVSLRALRNIPVLDRALPVIRCGCGHMPEGTQALKFCEACGTER